MRRLSPYSTLLLTAGVLGIIFLGIIFTNQPTSHRSGQLAGELSPLQPVDAEAIQWEVETTSTTYSSTASEGTLPPGKELRYIPISSECKVPEYLTGYGQNLCWNVTRKSSSVSKVTCAPSLVLLGVHKCGTNDLLHAMRSMKSINPHYHEPMSNLRTPRCPTAFFESGGESRFARQQSARSGQYLSINAGEAFRRAHLHEETEDHYLITSTVQYLSFFSSGNQRYLISLRNPTERFISNYFFMFETKAFNKIPILREHKSVDAIGNEFFHDLVERTIDYFTQCLGKHGVTGCIYLKTYNEEAPYPQMVVMMQHSCYYISMEQILHFIPRDQLYISMLEQYSVNKGEELQKIYNFWGIDPNKRQEKSKEEEKHHHKAKIGHPVLQKTRDLLDKFYEPFNRKLAELLGDEKWLWRRN